MANEAIKVELFGQNNSGDPVSYTCASGAAIAKGSLLVITSPRTAAASGTASSCALVGGIASMSKAADDHSTRISAWTNGIFNMVASGGITVGNLVKPSDIADNSVCSVTTYDRANPLKIGFGTALATVTDGQRVNIRINL